MTFIEDVLKVIAIIGGIIAAWLVGMYLWYSTPPRRPSGAPRSAAYYAGLALPIVGQNGLWVNCWFDDKVHVDRCRNISVKGKLVFEDIYVPYQGRFPVPQAQLLIDSEKMNDAQEQFDVSNGWVPLVYLRNGNVLVPQTAYQEATKRLDELQRANSPYAPPRIIQAQH